MIKTKIYSLLILLAFGLTGLHAQHYKTIQYTENTSVIINPERGLMNFTSVSSNGQYSQLDANTLKSYRSQGISLIFRYFYIERFTASDISSEYLSNMQKDFDAMREAGVKSIIRFAYCQSMNKPYGDAPLNIVLRHIEQLKPLLQANSDVIQVLQAGFIGAWGEWFYTDYFSNSPGVITDAQWKDRKTLVDALLEAMPLTRMVALRTPEYKQHMYSATSPLTLDVAYNESDLSRLAHHNDCFLASSNDVGTYRDTAKEKPYTAADSKYLSMGGETCGVSEPFSLCDNSLKEMARFHWSYLNQDYHPNVINGWKQNGCWEDIQRKLGYRYRLISSQVPDSAAPGGSVKIKVNLINDGWSNPFNPRDLKLILKNDVSGKVYEYKYGQDIRKLSLGTQQNLSFDIGVPTNISEGSYSLYLSLPDPMPTIKDRPEYAIQTANVNLWDPATGYNSLNAKIIVSKKLAQTPYSGSSFFSSGSPEVTAAANIITNGNFSDWLKVPDAIVTSTPSSAKAKISNSADSLFLLVESSSLKTSFQIFIDTDNSAATGYKAWQWTNNGAEFLIENGSLFKYSGTNQQWGWTFVKTLVFYQNSNGLEMSMSRTDIDISSNTKTIGIMYVNDQSGTPLYLPAQNGNPYLYSLYYQIPAPVVKTSGTQALIYWPDVADNKKFFVIQRSENNSTFKTISTKQHFNFYTVDTGLVISKNYYYRVLLVDKNNKAFSSPVTTVNSDGSEDPFFNIAFDGNDTEWNIIPPLATGGINSVYSLKMYNTESEIFYACASDNTTEYKIYLNTDNNFSTGNSNLAEQIGYDFLISNDSLYKAVLGSWEYLKIVTTAKSSNIIEGRLLFNDIAFSGFASFSLSVFFNKSSLHNSVSNVIYNIMSTVQAPNYFEVKNSTLNPDTKLILTWQTVTPSSGYVIERSVDDKLNFQKLIQLPSTAYTYHDATVNAAHAYFYRIFAYFDKIRSDYSEELGGFPGKVGVETLDNKQFSVEILPNIIYSYANINVSTQNNGKIKISIHDLQGRVVMDLGDQSIISTNFTKEIDFSKLSRGTYLVNVMYNSQRVTKKVVVL